MIVLRQGPLSVEISVDNPAYSTLKRFVGDTFTVEERNDKLIANSKYKVVGTEPSADEFIASLQSRAANDEIVPQITPTMVEDMAPFEITVNPRKIFEDLDKLYLENSVVKSLLHSHIEAVLGITESSGVNTSHYKASGKLSKEPFYTIYRHIPNKGLFYLTVRSDIHGASRE